MLVPMTADAQGGLQPFPRVRISPDKNTHHGGIHPNYWGIYELIGVFKAKAFHYKMVEREGQSDSK